MNREEIIKMAREVGYPLVEYEGTPYIPPLLEMLLETVAASQRKPLTDEDFRKLADKHLFYQPEGYEVSGVFALARAIEAAHGIKE